MVRVAVQAIAGFLLAQETKAGIPLLKDMTAALLEATLLQEAAAVRLLRVA